MTNDMISKKALLEQMDRMFLGADPADHEQNGIFKCRVLVKEAPVIEAEPVRHEGIITRITTDDLDKYHGMIIVDEGEKSKFCAVYYADNPGWEVFDDLSSAYYGKQMYFTQPDGTIYSRLSCGYMTFEEALSEFREQISMDGGAEG